ncbi:rap1 GTPase-GDP dissociation stimulator 1-A [Trichonephila inaurata madagascariensis]|uniref:Rap1 GTPase-GDP dissociation stimulator 1-A n=1 Tax=Trichonephila inaurata madagascariensis TaxID=2747483 RepID=A0A8X6ITW1_9ARAC|nr:rap1 GTPase-GDP dissociation stimulator 1-A [Trichonephila inaurata madagascariensis]
MDEITDQLSKLNLGIKENKTSPEIQKILMQINRQFSAEGSDKKTVVEYLLKNEIVDTFSLILKSRERFSASTFALVAEILAEIAKLDTGRQNCSEAAIIVPMLELLSNNDSNVVLQVCRALGNICYDNDVARSLVKEHNGVYRLIQLLRNLLEKENLPENMRTITSGCLLNLTDTFEEIQDQAIEAGILDVLLQYLLKFSSDEDVVTHCLLVLSCLADSHKGRAKILDRSVLSSLLNLLEKPLNDDIMDSLLELFGNLCENDSAKLSLVEMGLCEKLVDIIQKHRNSGSVVTGTFNINKSVPDLIILILTGDESMELLWKNGQGVVYKETLSWLKSNDENLLIAGALATGNFARKDSHCIQMLADGVVEQLKILLEKHTGRDGDIRMQHAVLSALRNLAIPAQNKSAMVKLGVVPILIDMMYVETFPVVFKLLGTVRMLIDKQEEVSKTVGENFDFVKRTVSWCCVEEHPGVKGEATRLLAWLAKNSKTPSVMKNLVKADALPPIISMMKSEHIVMQNEALIALSLISVSCLTEVEEISASTDLINILYQVMGGDIIVPELTQNALSLLVVLLCSAKMRSAVNSTPIRTDLKALKNHNDEKIRDLAGNALQMLETNNGP